MKKEVIFPESMPRPRVAYSPLVKAGPFVYVSGQLASDFSTGVPPAAKINAEFPNHGSDIERQTDFVLGYLRTLLDAGGSSMENCLLLGVYQTDPEELYGCARIMQDVFGANGVPPHAAIVVEELPIPFCILEVDAIAYIPENGESIEILNPATLPRPIPTGLDDRPLFNYGVKAGQYIFTSAIMATDYEHGVAPEAVLDPNFIYYAESARLQTEYILEKLKVILAEGGATMADVAKADIYLTDQNDFYRFEQVWKKHFPSDPPARNIVPVSDLGVPGIRIAINLIAYVPGDGPPKRTIHTDAAPTPIIHEPQAVQAGNLLFFSGQMAADYENGVAPEAEIDPNFPYFSSASERQVRYIVKNIDAICAAAGITRDHLVRRRGLYTDFTEFFTSFLTWGEEFPSDQPASTTVRVPTPAMVPGCKVVIDLMAMVPDAK